MNLNYNPWKIKFSSSSSSSLSLSLLVIVNMYMDRYSFCVSTYCITSPIASSLTRADGLVQ